MNTQIKPNEIQGAQRHSRDLLAEIQGQQQPRPEAVIKQTMYALTRRGKDGETEFATGLGDWTTDIAEAHMRHRPEQVSYCLPKEMDKTDGVISEVTMAVYDKKDFAPDVFTGRKQAPVIIARRTDHLDEVIEGSHPRLVTHGGIGKPDIVSDRPWQAVALPPQHGHADFARAAENVALPCYPVEIIEGGARRRIMRAAAHRFFGGVRCVSVSPVAGGAR